MDTIEMKNTLTAMHPHKAGKAQVWATVQALIEQAAERGESDNETLGHMAVLYSHFKPTPSKKARSWWDWLARPAINAAKAGDTRTSLHWVHVRKDGQAEATNGHALHRCPIHALASPTGATLEPGFYWPTGERVAEATAGAACTFPDTDRLNGEASDPYAYVTGERTYQEYEQKVLTAVELVPTEGESVHVDSKYWSEATEYPERQCFERQVTVQPGRMRLVMVSYGAAHAIIAPMRL